MQDNQQLLDKLNSEGIAVSHVNNVLQTEDLKIWEKSKEFFNDAKKNVNIKYLCELFSTNNNTQFLRNLTSKKKYYEITHFNLLNRGLGLEDYSLFSLYFCDSLLNIAKEYYQTTDLKLFNVTFWIHPKITFKYRENSQNWHRDTEDIKNLKIFIYYNNVSIKNGAFEYIVNSYAKCEEDLYNRFFEPYIHNAKSIEGSSGTIIFVNSTGFHRGGFVQEGERLASHACYLKSNALQVLNGPLLNINHNPKVNYIDFQSAAYDKLTDYQKSLLKQ